MRLDHFYGPMEMVSLLGNLHSVDVLMDVTGLDHLPIQTIISLGQSVDAPPYLVFN